MGTAESSSFGQWLKQRRKGLDLTQEALADRVGCSVVTIRKIESDDLRPSRQIAERLAGSLGIAAAEVADFVAFARSAGGEWRPAEVAPARPGESAPWRLPDRPVVKLPAALTTVVGREREVAAGCALLRRPEVRLVTLSGPPGIGKTRLALETAAALAEEWPGEVYFVPLAPIFDPQLVLSAIAQEVGTRESAGKSVLAALQERLSGRPALLVLDNFEQVVAAAPLVAELLRGAAGLKVLVTSRELLHVYGEQEFPVPPLALPDASKLPPLEALMLYPAVALFVQRAQAAKHDFGLTVENAAAVAGICAWLDGLPLAIEMAAARSKWFTPGVLLQRLSQRMALFTDGPRDLTPRQQTLRGAIDWSYDLLDEEERRLFSRLAVFRGGCAMEAAGAILDFGFGISDSIENPKSKIQHVSGRRAEVETRLHGLVDKSLLRYEADGEGNGRFWMLETIREYGLERLVSWGEEEAVRGAHAAYFLELAEKGEQGILGSEQGIWLRRLEREHDNLRAALAWGLERDRGTAVRLAGALWRFWQLLGHVSEGRRWLALAMQQERGDVSLATWAKAIFGAGALASNNNDHENACDLYNQCLALYRELGDSRGIAMALNGLAGLAFFAEVELDKAVMLYRESLNLRREIGDRWAVALSLNNLGVVEQNRGNLEEAHALHAESLAIRHELGDRWGIAQSLGNLGTTYYHLAPSRARLFFEQSLVIGRELGVRMAVADSLSGLGDVALVEGKLVEAAEHYRESLGLCQAYGDRLALGRVVERMASLALAQGALVTAARLLGAAEELLIILDGKKLLGERPHYPHLVSSLEARLDEATFVAERAAGREMSLDEVVELAFEVGGVKRET